MDIRTIRGLKVIRPTVVEFETNERVRDTPSNATVRFDIVTCALTVFFHHALGSVQKFK